MFRLKKRPLKASAKSTLNFKTPQIPGLTLVTLKDIDQAYADNLTAWAEAGLDAIQLRLKNQAEESVARWSERLLKQLKNLPTKLIVNDHLRAAFWSGAHGVHLGQGDFDPAEARRLLGPDKLIGWSVNAWDELLAANQRDDLDYIGASAIFPTGNKDDVRNFWGLEGLRQLALASRYPVVAIGGLTLANSGAVMAAGANGLAVIGAIHQAPDPLATIRKFKRLLAENPAA